MTPDHSAPDMSGNVVLVTGASSGIGRASAMAFSGAGAKVAVADIDASGGLETCELVRLTGGQATFIEVDISKANQVEAMVAKILDTYGRLDHAHNNAGILELTADLTDLSEAQWDQVIDVNLKGIWLCMKHEIRQMRALGGGAIVNTSSILGLVGGANAAYTASKHGIVGLTKAAALAHAKDGIRVNAVCPGWIDTPMVDAIIGDNAQIKSEVAGLHPIGRLGKPEEVAQAVLWLCSDAASFVTGHALPIDGGFVVH